MRSSLLFVQVIRLMVDHKSGKKVAITYTEEVTQAIFMDNNIRNLEVDSFDIDE